MYSVLFFFFPRTVLVTFAHNQYKNSMLINVISFLQDSLRLARWDVFGIAEGVWFYLQHCYPGRVQQLQRDIDSLFIENDEFMLILQYWPSILMEAQKTI